jgi:hypothetical protein
MNNNMMNNNMMNNNMMNNNMMNNNMMNNNMNNNIQLNVDNKSMRLQEPFGEDKVDPAYKTMTQNLADSETNVFTTQRQFQDAQSNFVPNVDPNVGIKSTHNQISIQGVDLPNGFDTSIYVGENF